MNPSLETIQAITAEHVRGWIDVLSESTTIELKRDAYQDLREWRKDISAMANADGGCIVIGIREENGIAAEFVGVPRAAVDSAMQRMEQSAASGIRERLNLKLREVQVDSASSVILCAVARSTYGPHGLEPEQQYYLRTSTTTAKMDNQQLRRAFRNGGDEIERAMQAHSQLAKAARCRKPFLLITGSPIPEEVDRFVPADQSHMERVRHITSGIPAQTFGVVFDGYEMDGGESSQFAIRRSGRVEYARKIMFAPSQTLEPDRLVAVVLQSLVVVLRSLKELQINQRVVLTLSLMGVGGMSVEAYLSVAPRPLSPQDLELPLQVVDEISDPREQALRVAAPWFERIWNACGYSQLGGYFEGPERTPTTRVRQLLGNG